MAFSSIPLCCKLAAGLGSEGGSEESGQEEVVGVLILPRLIFPEMKAVQQQEEEEGKALFWQEKDLFQVTLV